MKLYRFGLKIQVLIEGQKTQNSNRISIHRLFFSFVLNAEGEHCPACLTERGENLKIDVLT